MIIQDLCKGGEVGGRGQMTKVIELGVWGILSKKFVLGSMGGGGG